MTGDPKEISKYLEVNRWSINYGRLIGINLFFPVFVELHACPSEVKSVLSRVGSSPISENGLELSLIVLAIITLRANSSSHIYFIIFI